MAKKGGGSTTQTQGLDPQTQAYVDQVRNAATAAGNTAGAGVNPYTQGAADSFGQFAKGGNLGFSALTGDPTATASFMNPYQSNVIDATRAQFDQTRADTLRSVDDASTAAGAFGGTRADVARGAALSGVARDENSTIAGLNQQGYNDAMTRAGSAANLGFGANQQLASLGDYMRSIQNSNDPATRKLGFLLQGMGTPYGQTSTTTQQSGHNPFSGALGGAAAGSEFGPWGAGIGGLLGAFS